MWSTGPNNWQGLAVATDRAAARRAFAQWPIAVALCGVAAGLVFAMLVAWRPGAGVVGASVAVAALLRLLLPERVAGLLNVRSRRFDVLALTVLAVGIIVSAIVVPDAP